MKLIRASYQILSKIDGKEILKNIELAGRTCYKSEDKMTEESSEKFIEMLIKRGHESVLEHEKITIRFIVDRGVSHELVRHRIASFSQESTRYCNYSKDKFDNQLTFIIPCWLDILKEGEYMYSRDEVNVLCNNEAIYIPIGSLPELKGNRAIKYWISSMLDIEGRYSIMVKDGWTPQQARSILPNSLKTEIVVTANLREWRLILRQRTASAAHSQMREVMIPLLNELKTLLPVVFNDITY